MIKHPYHISVYRFVNIVTDLFEIDNLTNLHTLSRNKYTELFEVGKDSSTIFHQKFYNKYREGWSELEDTYSNFIYDIVSPLYAEDFLYQKFPTFRVHLPNNVAVGKFHNDADFGHPKGEVNYIIPLTDSDDTASVWVESQPSKIDFEPMEMRIAELIEFSGNTLTHGNKVNRTGRTRVSMDFRVLPLSKYDANNEGKSITLATKFIEGEYYKKFTHGK
jgi:hypothetical protein